MRLAVVLVVATTVAAACLGAAAEVSDADFYALQAKLARLETQATALLEELAAETEAASARNSRRRLAMTTGPTLAFEHPDASLNYANGVSLSEDVYGDMDEPALHSNADLISERNLRVEGAVHVDGVDLNLGMPLLAEEGLQRGDIVSMVASGGVARGFGMQTSTDLTNFPVASSSSIVRHADTMVSIVYTDTDGYLWAARFDSQGSTDAPELVNPDPVEHFTATALSPTLLVVCYKPVMLPSGYCRAATHAGVWDFGDTLELPQSGTYFNGVVTNLRDVEDRAVITYSMAAMPEDISTERTKSQILAITGLNTVVAQNSPRVLMTSKADHMSAVSLTSDRIIVSYRIDRDANTEVLELGFQDEFRNTILDSVRVDVGSGAANFSHTALDRLDDTHAIIAFRDYSNGYRVSSAIVDASDSRLLSVGPLTIVDSGTELAEDGPELRVSVTAPSQARVGFSFVDAQRRGVFVDAGVFGQAIVMGRPQFISSSGQSQTASLAAVRMGASTSFVVYQPVNTGTPRGQSVVRTTMFGGPTMLGLAKSGAASGEYVTVLLQGALDGFSGLRPGAPYYARYDGGIGEAPDELSGVSTALVGKALSPTVLLSVIGSNGDENSQTVARLEKEMASLSDTVDTAFYRAETLAGAMVNSRHYRPELAVFRYATWSTYSRRFGWYMGNQREFAGGNHPSDWGDSWATPHQVTDSKFIWATLFNKIMYANHDAVVASKEWYHYSSTNSYHTGVLMRIRNTTPNSISWTMYFYWSSSSSSYNEQAGIALNRVNQWTQNSNCGYCTRGQTMTIPADRISTVYFTTSSAHPSTSRTCLMAFYSNSLDLPDGLEWVDDLQYNYEGGGES